MATVLKQGLLIFVLISFSSGIAESAIPEETGLLSRIHFVSNDYQILEKEEQILDQNILWLQEHPEVILILEGHCDEFGEENYNLQLGDLRAREVKASLIAKGIDAERIIMIVSFGESRPLDTRPLREAYEQNRRVEFILR